MRLSSFEGFVREAERKMGTKRRCKASELESLEVVGLRAALRDEGECRIYYSPKVARGEEAEFVAYHEVAHEAINEYCKENEGSPLCKAGAGAAELMADSLAKAYIGKKGGRYPKSCCLPELDKLTSRLAELIDPSKPAIENLEELF